MTTKLRLLLCSSLLAGCLDPAADEHAPDGYDGDHADVHDDALAAEAAPGQPRRTLLRRRDGTLVEADVTVRNGLVFLDGDMLIGREEQIVAPGSGIPRANVLRDAGDLWPSTIIPYTTDDLDPAQVTMVEDAIAEWEAKTAFRFKVRTTETDYLEFVNDDDGCYSWVGRDGFGQNINLEPGVCRLGNTIHEIGHALGLYHEHQRSDRNTYIDYHGMDVPLIDGLVNYAIDGTALGPFDWGSIMLYHSFSTDSNNPVMLAKDRWSVRSAGNGAWASFRRGEVTELRDVHFGDFDNDGRTDALRLAGSLVFIARGVGGTPQPPWQLYGASNTAWDGVRVGQFDADPRADLFRADGTGWYYSSAGNGPWVKINNSTTWDWELYLGDFDADGYTDVLRPDGSTWQWSARGRSPWDRRNTSGYTHGSIAVGSFDAVPGDDILVTTGTEWRYASGGQGRTQLLQTSTTLAKDLLVGHFQAVPNGISDILHPGAVGRYDISIDGRAPWAQHAGVNGFQGTPGPNYARVVDINDDGRDDVLMQGFFTGQRTGLSEYDVAGIHRLYFGTWQVSRGGNTAWAYLNESNVPMTQLALCDFDGDNIDDVFRADGTKWSMSKSGTGDWVTLNTSGYEIDEIALGDFDNDGRCDVFRTDGTRWWMSKSGTGAWVQRNTSGYELEDLKFADMDGNGSTDVFVATGTEWLVSWGGSSSFQKLNTSGVTNVMLADLDNDKAADVFHATGTHFQYSKRGTSGWITLNTSGHAMSSITLADFTGDGRADVLRPDGTRWWMSRGGTGAWEQLNVAGYTLSALRIGHLDLDKKADVMTAFPRFAQ